MINWLHHLFYPHCPDCIRERLEAKHCESCETLKEQIAFERSEKERLLELLIQKNTPVPDTPRAPMEIVKPGHIPWRVKQQELETRDRKLAEVDRTRTVDNFKKDNPELEELEKEVLGTKIEGI